MAKESPCSSEPLSTSMEHVLLLSSLPTVKEQLKACCKPTYQIRKLKNKGAILVLIWNFLVMNLFYYLSTHVTDQRPHYITWGITLPIAGWLADVHLGRYKVIRWSMWIMWAGSILATTSSVVAQLVGNYSNICNRVTLALLILTSIGFGGCQANIIQFGIDQLHDASTTEITSFISWYTWTCVSGGIAIDYAYKCAPEEYHILGQFVVCICLTIMLSLSLLFGDQLVKEPVTQNPFKLVYNVIQYAIKNARPKRRSAFTYCEDDLPSRIDFGKAKYGGPFTTEQVEDVKTFLRLLTVVFVGCTLPSVVGIVSDLRNQVIKLFTHSNQLDTPTIDCYLGKFYANTLFFSAAVLIPLYEFVFYPVLRKYFSWVKSYWKFSLGVALQLARVITLMAFELIARHTYLEHHGSIQCIFAEKDGVLSTSFNIKWMILPNVLNSLSVVILGIGGIEFICAQTPYSMKGLMFGVVYGSVAVFAVIGYGIAQPFTKQLSIWGTGMVSCGFWYLMLIASFLVFDSAVLSVLGKLYKKRKREDVLPNEQIFAERYYSRQY